MPLIACPTRALVSMNGADCEGLLQRLITTNLDKVQKGQAGFGALLAPQGKILMDFLVIRQETGFLFDMHSQLVDAFIKKMTLYKMRSDVSLEKDSRIVAVSLNQLQSEEAGQTALMVKDPRHTLLGWRCYLPKDHEVDLQEDRQSLVRAHIEAGVPQGSVEEGQGDFVYGTLFPHDAHLDQLGGIDYEKGCYVGQEVVSRMHHRGTARKRMVKVSADGPLLSQSAIVVDNKTIGQIGLAQGNQALAQVRLDRLSAAFSNNQSVQSEQGQSLSISLPDYVDFADQLDQP
ncbi:MAG: folate-binding protein [Cohaesibacter sp.]|nr:folate-binding protein [Cohaesibacter sp.]MCV6600450.1 folate-binding protein [Cohaesibacter sp.]